jgi:hypothetical protein
MVGYIRDGRMMMGSRKEKIASVPVGVPEFKVKWEGHPIPHPVTYTRMSDVALFAEISGPDNIMNDGVNAVRECAVAALGTAAVAAIIADPAAAVPAFKAAFIACMAGKIGGEANQLDVGLSTEQEPGVWHKV